MYTAVFTHARTQAPRSPVHTAPYQYRSTRLPPRRLKPARTMAMDPKLTQWPATETPIQKWAAKPKTQKPTPPLCAGPGFSPHHGHARCALKRIRRIQKPQWRARDRMRTSRTVAAPVVIRRKTADDGLHHRCSKPLLTAFLSLHAHSLK